MTTPCEQYVHALNSIHAQYDTFCDMFVRCSQSNAFDKNVATENLRVLRECKKQLVDKMPEFYSNFERKYLIFPGKAYAMLKKLANTLNEPIRNCSVMRMNEDGVMVSAVDFGKKSHAIVILLNKTERIYCELDGKKIAKCNNVFIAPNGAVCGGVSFGDDVYYPFIIFPDGTEKVFYKIDNKDFAKCVITNVSINNVFCGYVNFDPLLKGKYFIITPDGKDMVYYSVEDFKILDNVSVGPDGIYGLASHGGPQYYPFVITKDNSEKVFQTIDNKEIKDSRISCCGASVNDDGTLCGSVAFYNSDRSFVPFMKKSNGEEKVYYTIDNKETKNSNDVFIGRDSTLYGRVEFKNQKTGTLYPFKIMPDGTEKVYYTIGGEEIFDVRALNVNDDGILSGLFVPLRRKNSNVSFFIIESDNTMFVQDTINSKGINTCNINGTYFDGTISATVKVVDADDTCNIIYDGEKYTTFPIKPQKKT